MTDQLSDALARIKRPGAFATQRTVAAHDLELEVVGAGPIRFPISKTKARELCALGRPARYGLKDKTLLNRKVRDSSEISKNRLKIAPRSWKATLLPELDRIRADLGLGEGRKLRAELHNLLVYGPGQFFLPHQDSEKSDDMIGTLVVTLPSAFTGGGIVVRHQGEKVTFRGSSKELTFIAFYADCQHEVLPVRDGYRVVLTYNLLVSNPGADTLPASRELDSLEMCVREFFQTVPTQRWPGAAPSGPPDRLVYLLDHQYSQKGLGWGRLKNADGPRSAALREVARRLECEIFLALVEVHESWSCEDEESPYARYGDYERYGRRSSRRRFGRSAGRDAYRGEDDEDEDNDQGPAGTIDDDMLELTALHDTTVDLRYFVDANGKAEPASGNVATGELCATKPSVELDPFKSEHEGYMGNWGNTVDRWYHRAAVVLWPRQRTFLIHAKASAAWALRELASVLGDGRVNVARTMAAELAPFWSRVARAESGAGWIQNTLSVSLALGAPKLAGLLLAPIQLEQLTPRMAKGLSALVERYGFKWARSTFAAWMSGEHYESREPRTEWLAAAPAFIRALLAAGAQAVVAFARWIVTGQWSWLTERYRAAARVLPSQVRKSLVRLDKPLLGLIESSLATGDQALHASMLGFLTSNACPLLALTSLLESARRIHRAEAVSLLDLGALVNHCDAELARYLEQPVRSPDDWSVLPPKLCPCALCSELSRFLLDRSRVRFEWPLTAEKREHVQRAISTHELPVTHVTRRSGRPFTLVLVKTRQLFEREATERVTWKRALDGLRHPGSAIRKKAWAHSAAQSQRKRKSGTSRKSNR